MARRPGAQVKMNLSDAASWNEAAARLAINAIAADAYDHFDPDRYWPAHPMDEWVRDGDTTLYWGAAGNILALDHLAREGAVEQQREFAPLLPKLLERNRAAFAATAPMTRMDSSQASLLMGDIGPVLLMTRLSPSAQTSEELHRRIAANLGLPSAELMWGVPGTMLACLFQHELTDESRWRSLYLAQAGKLLAKLEETESGTMWTQALYGRSFRFLGLVHGFAGNVLALLRGCNWLGEAQQQRIRDALARTLPANAMHDDRGANWRPDAFGPMEARLVQICHGAPGVIVACSHSRALAPELRALLCEGGECIWQ